MRAAVVGFGAIAERAHLAALASCGVEVVAIVDPSEDRRAAGAGHVGTAATFARLEDALAAVPIDIVDVCTPPDCHVEVATLAAAAGAHVLVEKPLAIQLVAAEALASVAAESHSVVACVHNWTHAPIVARGVELVRGGEVGDVVTIEIGVERTEPAGVSAGANWRVDPARAGGGIVFDHGWHAMSIALRMIEQAPLDVTANLERRRAGLAVEDTAEVSVRFPRGIELRFVATWAGQARRNWIHVLGTRGTLEIMDDRLVFGGGEERFAESLAAGGYRPGWTAGSVRELLAEIAEPARRGRALAEALTCMRLVAGAYRSAADQARPLAIDPPMPAARALG